MELVYQFVLELAEYVKRPHEVTAGVAMLKANLFGEKPCAEVALAFVGDTPAGFAVFFQNFSTFLGRPGLYLEDLFVRPEQRGRGVGSALLAHLARLANRRGCSRFEWAVLDWNTSAQEFYHSVGAEILHDLRVCRLSGDALRGYGV